MTTTDPGVEHLNKIATPTRVGLHLGSKLWGVGTQYRVDPWLARAEQVIVPAIIDRDVENFVMLNTPPQIGKTSYSGELLPFWILGMFPDTRIIFITYSDDYSKTKGSVVRDMIRAFGPKLFGVDVDANFASAGDWRIAGHRGGMLSVGIGSQITGRSGDIILIDDVIKNAEEAASAAAKKRMIAEYDSTIRTRLQPGGTIVITATRWAEDDLSGILQERQEAPDYDGDVYQVLSFPAIAEPEEDDDEPDPAWRDELGREEGEPLLCRYTRPAEERDRNHFYRVRRSIDGFTFSCLFQQRPSARKGGMFPRGNWRYFDPLDHPYIVQQMRIWDLAATEDGGDYTVGSKVGKDANGEWYVLDVIRRQHNASNVRKLVIETAKLDGHVCRIGIEESRDGAGKSVVAFYKDDPELAGYNVKACRAEGQKESRATPYSTLQTGGHFFLPSGAPWVKEFVDEHKQMMGDGRKPKHDDQIDTVAYAVLEMGTAGPVRILDPTDYHPDAERAMRDLADRLSVGVR